MSKKFKNSIKSRISYLNAEIITIATHSYGLFDKLINNKYSHVKVLGFGQKWTGFNMKFELLNNYIKHLPDDKIIVFVDGFDSIIDGKLEDAVNIFKQKNYKLLFSKDRLHSLDAVYHLNKIYCKDKIVVNTGLYMGYVKYLKLILNDMICKKCNDDQINLNRSCKKYPFIDIDMDENIFKNINNIDEIANSKAIFYQIPGKRSFTRTLRATYEYGQFMLILIIILYLFLFLISLYFKQKNIIIIITLIFTFYYCYMDKSCI